MNLKLASNRALQKIRSGGLVSLYVTGNFSSPRHVDFVGSSGHFDAIWFDLEHFDIPTRELATLCLVARAHPVTTIARLKATDYQVVMRTLETGVGGIMCSMVQDEVEAARIVSWAKFNNPQPGSGETTGQRGWNGGNIDGRYGSLAPVDYMNYQNTQVMVICQIEHDQAVDRAEAIAAVPGVDGLFFGPGDYSASIGLPGQIGHERVVAAMQRVADAAKATGKFWGTVAPGPELFAKVVSMGAQLVCPGGDIKVMTYGLRELVRTMTSGSGSMNANGSTY